MPATYETAPETGSGTKKYLTLLFGIIGVSLAVLLVAAVIRAIVLTLVQRRREAVVKDQTSGSSDTSSFEMEPAEKAHLVPSSPARDTEATDCTAATAAMNHASASDGPEKGFQKHI
ncbi:hypothetical protein B0A50_02356 [Salinomyces thailandicus]|uniref:Uncharacterized protein n=1 Tax=Salinomyces thailandicus TaxID=706561 RepID=A0A4U0U876_9PEZI|nr:hypothetical protein B0A50_02356 [Salinomyces thailandica]